MYMQLCTFIVMGIKIDIPFFRSVDISFPRSADLTKFEALIKCMLLNLEIYSLGRDARKME